MGARIDALDAAVAALAARVAALENLPAQCAAANAAQFDHLRASSHANMRAMADVIAADVKAALAPAIRAAVTEVVRHRTLTAGASPPLAPASG